MSSVTRLENKELVVELKHVVPTTKMFLVLKE